MGGRLPGAAALGRIIRVPRRDGVTVLTIYLVLLYAIPSDRTIGPLGGAGSPAAVFITVAAIWWCWYQLSKSDSPLDRGPNPVRVAMFILLGVTLASYVVAMVRPISEEEVSTADLGLLRMLAFTGVLLVSSDLIPDEERLRTLLRRMIFAGALFAALGLVQFIAGQSFIDVIEIPGLTKSQEFSAVQDRSGFARAAGTAMSPLEYAAVLSMILPIALGFALEDRDRSPWRRWTPLALIVSALALSGSRSALLGLAIGVIVLFPTWSGAVRIRAAMVALVGSAAVYFLVPGMIGTLRGLFLNASNDPSTASRTGSYDLVMEFIARSPFLGRGFGTFLPPYRILDNQFLLTTVEVGVVGLVALIALLGTGVIIAVLGRRWATSPLMSQLGQALAGSVLAGSVLAAFFDAFSFRMAAGTLFLILGLCGAYWRLSRREGDRGPAASITSRP